MTDYSYLTERFEEMVQKYPGFRGLVNEVMTPAFEEDLSPSEKRYFMMALMLGYTRGRKDAS